MFTNLFIQGNKNKQYVHYFVRLLNVSNFLPEISSAIIENMKDIDNTHIGDTAYVAGQRGYSSLACMASYIIPIDWSSNVFQLLCSHTKLYWCPFVFKTISSTVWTKYINPICRIYEYCIELLNFKRKFLIRTGTRTRTSRSLAWSSTLELSWFSCQFKKRVWRRTGRRTRIAQWYSARLEIWRSKFESRFRFKFFS